MVVEDDRTLDRTVVVVVVAVDVAVLLNGYTVEHDNVAPVAEVVAVVMTAYHLADEYDALDPNRLYDVFDHHDAYDDDHDHNLLSHLQ